MMSGQVQILKSIILVHDESVIYNVKIDTYQSLCFKSVELSSLSQALPWHD